MPPLRTYTAHCEALETHPEVQELPEANAVTSILLTPEEIAEYTGYKHTQRQLEVLHKSGFWRASQDRFGRVRLERAHFEAVCAGAVPPEMSRERPRVRNVRAEA